MIEVVPLHGLGNAIVTLAVGDMYLENWEKNVSDGWIAYCKRHNLGLFIEEHSLDERNNAKKKQWQKLLVVERLAQKAPNVKTFCYLDSDIAINPQSRSIFDDIDSKKLNLVSQFKNMPFLVRRAQKMVSFHRHHFISKKYPLDSAIFMRPEEIFAFHGLPIFDDYACTGLIAGGTSQFARVFREIYEIYDKDVNSITGGDEPILNYEFLSRFEINWLPYEYQALWLFEMALNYPFLYSKEKIDSELVRKCVDAVLSRVSFLHFAGSWYESDLIHVGNFLQNAEYLKALMDYLKVEPRGEPQGLIRP